MQKLKLTLGPTPEDTYLTDSSGNIYGLIKSIVITSEAFQPLNTITMEYMAPSKTPDGHTVWEPHCLSDIIMDSCEVLLEIPKSEALLESKACPPLVTP
jgi:hypothetical protein